MTTTDVPPMIVEDEEDNPLLTKTPDLDIPSEEAPRKRRKRSDAGQPRGPRGTRKRATTLAKKITSGVHLVAAGLSQIDTFDAAIVAHNAERLGNAWAPVVENNPRIAALFANLEKGGVWGAAILSSLSVALPILLHHRPDLLPPAAKAVAFSMIPPEIHAQMAQQAQQQAQHAAADGA